MPWQPVLLVLLLLATPRVGWPQQIIDAVRRAETMERGGRIVSAAPMVVTRAGHTATRLASGKVLMVGGCTANGCEGSNASATTELYDPATGTFTRSATLTSPRVGGHWAALLPDGRVLIAGGWDTTRPVASAELYDARRDRFTAASPMTTARSAATATVMRDGRILVAGGFDGATQLASAEIYDSRTGAFAATGSMAERRAEHVAALLADGRVLVTGGSGGRGSVLTGAEIFDPATGKFSSAGNMSVGRYKHAMVGAADSSVLVIGGSDARDGRGRYASVERFRPRRGFSGAGRMSAARYKIVNAVVRLSSGAILIAGGARHAELYDPAARAFTRIDGELDAARAFSTATELPNGDVLIAGGYDEGIRVTNRAWIYRTR